MAIPGMAIPGMHEDKKLIGYLTRPEIDANINNPDTATWAGRRDRTLLLTVELVYQSWQH